MDGIGVAEMTCLPLDWQRIPEDVGIFPSPKKSVATAYSEFQIATNPVRPNGEELGWSSHMYVKPASASFAHREFGKLRRLGTQWIMDRSVAPEFIK